MAYCKKNCKMPSMGRARARPGAVIYNPPRVELNSVKNYKKSLESFVAAHWLRKKYSIFNFQCSIINANAWDLLQPLSRTLQGV
jgi:hypothetical protein